MPAPTLVELNKGSFQSDEGAIWINPEHIAYLLPLPNHGGTSVHLNQGAEKPVCLYVRETPNEVLHFIAMSQSR